MGAVKGVVTYACDILDISLNEAMEMTIQELQSAIRVAEDKLDEHNSQQSNDWDVDVDENGPFICIAEKEKDEWNQL